MQFLRVGVNSCMYAYIKDFSSVLDMGLGSLLFGIFLVG